MSENSRPTIVVVDLGAGGAQTERPMTDVEFAEYEANIVESEKIQIENNKQLEHQEVVNKSGRDKLKALGLTDEEIAALVG
tara:strand:+ start:878 stop:1120 length:243 start_codon:yes stop_codon:yes gene_type:complete